MRPEISIITVNFKQPKVTCELLDTLKKVTETNFEVIVVENGSGDNSTELISSAHPEVKLVVSEKNLGFAGGNNLGLAYAKGEFILFLNNDTEVEPGFLSSMLNVFKENARAGVVSPKIVFKEPANVIQYAGAISINPFTGRGKKIGNKEEDNGQYDHVSETELGHGAAFMVPREVIDKVGGMPEHYFLYYEEHDWCEQIKRAGYKVFYNGKARIIHKESVSIGKVNPLKVYYMNRNRLIYLRRNCTSFWQKTASLSFYFALAFPKKLISYMVKGQIHFVKALLSGAREGLLLHGIHKSFPVKASSVSTNSEILN